MEATELEQVECKHAEGTRYMAFKAHNRNANWRDICCELIDNANMAAVPGVAATVVIEWGGSKGDHWFSCADDGQGADDLDPFFIIGLSMGKAVSRGASTFGMGLFGVECMIDGTLTVVTAKDGILYGGRRRVSETDGKYGRLPQLQATDANCRRRGMARNVGTLLHFSRITKRLPNRKDVAAIAVYLGEVYSGAIREDELRIELRSSGEIFKVTAERPIAVQESYEQTIEVGGHTYHVKWGVTSETNRDNGMRLMYGGKLCGTTAKPCVEYAIDRFYAELVIPRSIGRDSMDIYKRAVDSEVMAPVYDELAILFDDALVKADELSHDRKFQSLNDAIKQILRGKKPRESSGNSDAGNVDSRDFNGRDPNGEGVQPKNTGRQRSGRKGGRRKPSDSLDVHWAPLGKDKELCKFDATGMRMTYNSDNAELVMLRDSQDKLAPFTLAAIAAGYMAFALKSSCGYGSYDWQFRQSIRWASLG